MKESIKRTQGARLIATLAAVLCLMTTAASTATAYFDTPSLLNLYSDIRSLT